MELLSYLIPEQRNINQRAVDTLNLRFQSGVFVDTDSGIYINGNPVITGSSASEGDTLQTVTDRGATTTNAISITNTSAGALAVDTDTLYVDASNDRVGINEDSVDATLHLTNVGGGVVNQKFERAGASAWRLGIPNGQTYFAFDDANDALSSPKLVITKTDGYVGINDTSPSYPLDVNGTIRSQDSSGGGLKGFLGNNPGVATTIENFFANTSTEDYGFQNALVLNDLAGFSKWKGVTMVTSGFFKTRGGSEGSYTYTNEATTGDFDRAFQAHNNTVGSWYSASGPSGDAPTGTGVIELHFEGLETLNYGAQVGIIFGSNPFRATHVKIEVARTGGWQEVIDVKDNAETAVISRVGTNSGGSDGISGIRYSIAKAGSYFRINNFYAADYAAGDDLSYGGQYYIDKYYDGRHYSTLRPVNSGESDLGTSSVRYGNSYIDYGRFTNAVGIGTNTLTYNFNVVSNSDILAHFKSTDNKASLLIQDNDSAGYVSVESNRMAIGPQNGLNTGNINILLDNGYVGIGTHNPGF